MRTSIIKASLVLTLIALMPFNSTANNISNSTSFGIEFTSLELKYDQEAPLILGQKINIGVIAINVKGKEFKTMGFLEGRVRIVKWSDLKIETEGCSYVDGAVYVNDEVADIPNHTLKIKASFIDQPDVKAEISIQLNYIGTVMLVFDGDHGKRGQNGQSGQKGKNVVTGGSKEQPGVGGNGGQGGNGTNGGDGQFIDVYLKLTMDEVLKKEMLTILAISRTTGKKQLSYMEPNEGRLVLTVNGGNGGSGGSGGQGGTGGDDNYTQHSANGGMGGNGGIGGDGGDGGGVILHIDPNTENVNIKLDYSNAGGLAGSAGSKGDGGFKGYNNDSSNGPAGTSGSSGRAGNKGAQIEVIEEKVTLIN